MLQVHGLHKAYGAATVLAGATFIINEREHVGLIGPNGAGKSTILRCLTGYERPDSGTITLTPPVTVGYLPQAFAELSGLTLAQALTNAQAEHQAAERALQHAADQLAQASDLEAAMAAYDTALAHFEALGGYEREHHAAAVLQGLGLAEIDQAMPVAQLSGGQKTRLGLATLLLRAPGLLLLDEPTNHLDVGALEWLEEFVRGYPGAVLIVSHDRTFLDQTVTRILYLDPTTHTIKSYTGGYTDFAEARAHEQALHIETWKKQQDYIAQVETDIARLKGQALSVELTTTSAQPTVRRYAKKVAKKAKSRERKLERYLESDERVDKPRQNWGLKLDFGEPPSGARAVLRVEEVAFGYPAITATEDGRRKTVQTQDIASQQDIAPQRPTTNDQPSMVNDQQLSVIGSQSSLVGGQSSLVGGQSSLVGGQSSLFAAVSFEVGYGERLAIVGPNGAGKTTLLKLLAGQLQPTQGRIRLGANVRLGLLAQEQEALDLTRTVLDMVRREHPMGETEARNFLHFFLFGGDAVFRPVGACSLGERARLQLALLVLRGCNLLLLDEPLNHLDIEGREHFEQALDAFEGTIIAVAHDRTFLAGFAERVLEVRDGRVSEVG